MILAGVKYLGSAAPDRTATGADPGQHPTATRSDQRPRRLVACARTFTLVSYTRAGAMLAEARLPTKKRPDVIDALVVIAAALHGPAQILTSDPDDITAYAATLDRADIVAEPIS
ncbi:MULTISPECIES: hypothetical protein [Frankia]|nr:MULTISPECIES: hypothetical protein [Frankia]